MQNTAYIEDACNLISTDSLSEMDIFPNSFSREIGVL